MATIDINTVIAKVKDDSGRLTQGDDYQPAVDAALEQYANHRPKELVKDLAGNGTHDLALPAEWVDEFSRVRQVEYPVDEVPEVYLLPSEWKVYRKPTGPVLRLFYDEPAATESIRVTITVPRAANEVAQGDRDAVANLAAGICCDILAQIFANTNDPTIAADVVNYRSKSDEYARRAKNLRGKYTAHIGIDADGGAPASMTVAPAPGSGSGLTHRRR